MPRQFRLRQRSKGKENDYKPTADNMARLAIYGAASTALAASVIGTAFRQRSNFYAAMIYLSKSSACMMVGAAGLAGSND